MIEVSNVTKLFGGRPAVRDVSFKVEKGQILGFLGPNGAGKTTMMRILTCYIAPDAGTARVDGLDVFEESLEVRKRIGYLPETPPLYGEMIVRPYLEFVARIRGIPSSRRRGSVDAAMERCGVTEVAGRLIGNLSKGFRQRVGLAQAIIHDPPVLILDEPTVGLDPEQIVEIRKLIRSLGGDHTVILSTHTLPEVTVTCTRVAIISYGAIVQEGSLDALAEEDAGRARVRVRVARDGQGVAETLRRQPGVLEVQEAGTGTYLVESCPGDEVREAVAAAAVNGNWGLLELTPVARTLEQVYLEATRRLPHEREAAGPRARSALSTEKPEADQRRKAGVAAGGGPA